MQTKADERVAEGQLTESGFCIGAYRSASAPFWMSDRCDVYKGVGPKNRRVLIKRLNKKAAADPAMGEAFRAEASTHQAISRMHVASVPEYVDFVEEDGDGALIQELVDGKPLTTPHRGERFERLRPYEVRRFLDQMLQTLREMHRLGYVHNDIKPVNILCRPIDPLQPYILVDFQNAERRGPAGRYQETRTEVDNERPDSVIGLMETSASVAYRAPERDGGGHGYFCSVIFSLGIIAIQLLTGAELHELSWNIQGLITLPLYPFAKDPILERVLVTMTCLSPLQRYQDVDEVMTALVKQPKGEILDKPVEQPRTTRNVIAVVLLLIFLVAGYFAWKSAVTQYCKASIDCGSR